MIDLEHQYSRPEGRGTVTICGRTVELFRCHDFMMGKTRFFWRADCNGETITTMCATRKECVEEARDYLRGKLKEAANHV